MTDAAPSGGSSTGSEPQVVNQPGERKLPVDAPASKKNVQHNQIIAEATGATSRAAPPASGETSSTGKPESGSASAAGELTDEQVAAWLKSKGHKLKARGKEVPVESLEQLLHHANRSFGAEILMERGKRAQEEAARERQARALVASRTANIDDRLAAFDALGIPDDVLEEKLLRRIDAIEKDKALSPEAKEYRSIIERQNAELEKFHAMQREAQEQFARQQYEQQVAEKRELAAGLALDVSKQLGIKLDKAPMVLQLTAQAIALNEEAGTPSTREQVAAAVQEELKEQFSGVVDSMDGASLATFIGQKNVKKLADYWLAQVRGIAPPREGQVIPAQPQQRTPPTEKPGFGTPSFFRKL